MVNLCKFSRKMGQKKRGKGDESTKFKQLVEKDEETD